MKRKQIRVPRPNFRGLLKTHIYYRLFNGDILVGPYRDLEHAVMFSIKQLSYLNEEK